MSVTGYLALYTTLIGWQQYQNLWALMVGTGLVFIPFIGIVLKSFLEPFESQEPKSAAVIALRRLMIQTVGALLIIEFCCVPSVSLAPKVLHYEPACSTQVATPGHTGTTYDNQYKAITGVKVPILWYLVMSVSNGFTHAATEGITCQKLDYRQLQSSLNLTRITNPHTKRETIAFYNDCYVPAYSKYMSEDLNNSQKAELQQYQKQYGQDDLGWIGSEAFLHTPGFYNTFSAQTPIGGFLFNPARDQYEGQVNDHSKWGEPNCQAWWSDPQHGLHKKLESALPASFMTAITHVDDNSQQLADAGIRNLIKHSFDQGMTLGEIARGYESIDQEMHGNSFSEHLGSKLGVALEGMSYYPKLTLLINALPVIQALLLMSIYALLALAIPFSSYRLHFIITGSAAIFAITFWSYLWHLVLYLDNTLIPALYSNPNPVKGFVAFLAGSRSNSEFLDFIIGTLYVALPMLFLMIMTWAGLKVSNSIMGAVSEMKKPGDAAGAQAGNLGRQAINMAVSGAKTGLTKKS
jgi:hypothetical protein